MERTQRIFAFDGDFYTYTGKLFDLLAINVFWLLGSLPIFSAGAAFAAMYDTVILSVRKDRDTMGRHFWRVWKRDLVQSIPLWGMVLGAAFVLLLNIGILGKKTDGLVGLFFMVFYFVCLALLLIAACYAFPALSRFKMPVRWIVKLAFYMTFRYFPISLLLLAILGAAYYLLLQQPLLALVVPSVFTLAASMLVEPLLERHSPKSDEKNEEETK